MSRIQIKALVLDYSESGTGVPVVFIPGITESKEAFAFQLCGLGDSYRVISYDVHRGLKRSADYTLDLLVNDLRMLLDALKVDSAAICGHSFGGLIAMQFAVQFPERTKALVLVSAFPTSPELRQDRLLGWISSAGHPFHKSLGTSFKVHISRLLGRRTSGALAMRDQVSAVRGIAAQAAKVSRATVNQRMRIIQKTDLRPALSQIQAPTLVVVGAGDRSLFLSSAQELYESIPEASLEVIESGAHFCFLTRHDRFNTAVDEFLTEHLAQLL
ncbi:MAG TPA: alpha/beta hydrolase [Armatimonadota bacterium]|nr:alpha/beta hydrolase [Armatimonadota bacterium]